MMIDSWAFLAKTSTIFSSCEFIETISINEESLKSKQCRFGRCVENGVELWYIETDRVCCYLKIAKLEIKNYFMGL